MDNYQDEQSAIARRQRIAEMLMAQGAEPLETNQVAGGYVVPVSPLAGIAKVAQQLSGAYIGRKADEREAKLEQDRANALVGVDFSAPDAPAQLAKSGYTKEAVALAMQRAKGGGSAPHLLNTQVVMGKNGQPVIVGFNSDASTKEFTDYQPMIPQKSIDTGSEILQVPAKAPWGMQQPTAPAVQPMPQSATVTSPTGEVRNYSRKQIEFGLAAHGTKEGLVQYLREGGQLPPDQEIDAINGRNQAQGMPIQGSMPIKKELPPNQTLDYLGQAEAAKSAASLPYDIERKRQEAAIAASTPKPMSEFQQWTAAQKEEKKALDAQDAVSNIDDTIGDFNRLKAIQARTTTGPIAGSPLIAALRKMGPNSITGGEDLQRLEKGYNTLAVKAIGAFKAGGVSFGQLSNKEGEWIKSTQETIDTGGNINQEMLDEGLRLLNARKSRIARVAGITAPTEEAPKTPAATGGWSIEEVQ